MIFHDWVETEMISELDPIGWYQYQVGGSAGHIIYDDSGNERNLEADIGNEPALLTNILNGHPAWYFDGTNDPLVWSGTVTVKHVFILASQADAEFDGYQGLLTGETLGDVLVGEDSEARFFDLSLTGFEYTKAGTAYADNNQLAPVSGNFALMEVTSEPGITLDGIQLGQQKADATRQWKGHFVEMILFDRVLTRDELRRVRLYFNIKFKLSTVQGAPLYFPSADIVPTIGPARFYDLPKDYDKITDDWEYEDGTKDFNEIADDTCQRWEYAYPASVPKAQKPIFDEFWNLARKARTFLFKDPEDYVWTNVRNEDYSRTHQAHMRWRHEPSFRLVGYNTVGTYEAPEVVDETAPSVPAGLAAESSVSTEMDLTWSASTD